MDLLWIAIIVGLSALTPNLARALDTKLARLGVQVEVDSATRHTDHITV